MKDTGGDSDLRRRQLPLRFPMQPRCTLDEFEAGPNAEAVAAVGVRDGGEFRALWIAGERGSGKSHLLQAACHAAVGRNENAAYLPAQLRAAGPGILDGLEHFRLVAIDDVGDWLGSAAWEEAVLALYQRLFDRRATLVLAANVVPAGLTIGLADLASRLRSAETHTLAPLDDADRARAMQRWAVRRGLTFGADVLPFLLRRLPRRMDALWSAFERLDGASLAQQRRLTIPLVKEILDL